jgi:hypothetical protein
MPLFAFLSSEWEGCKKDESKAGIPASNAHHASCAAPIHNICGVKPSAPTDAMRQFQLSSFSLQAASYLVYKQYTVLFAFLR